MYGALLAGVGGGVDAQTRLAPSFPDCDRRVLESFWFALLRCEALANSMSDVTKAKRSACFDGERQGRRCLVAEMLRRSERQRLLLPSPDKRHLRATTAQWVLLLLGATADVRRDWALDALVRRRNISRVNRGPLHMDCPGCFHDSFARNQSP